MIMNIPSLIKRLACALSVSVFAAGAAVADDNNICLHLRSGEKVIFAIEDHPVVTFDAKNTLTIKDSSKKVTTNTYETLHKITFNEPSAGINDVVAGSQREIVAVGPHDVALIGFAEGTPVMVVDVNGAVVLSAKVNNASAFVVSLASMSKGVYIVNAGAISYKIAIK